MRNSVTKLEKNLKSTQQARLEGYFKAIPKTQEEVKNLKRKNDEKNEEKKKRAKAEAKDKKAAKAKPKLNS